MIRFWLIGLLFWPVFVIGGANGQWLGGALLGLLVVAAAEVAAWRITTGEWPRVPPHGNAASANDKTGMTGKAATGGGAQEQQPEHATSGLHTIP